MRYEMISADCHVDLCWLPPDLFTANAAPGLRDRMPQVVDGPKGPTWITKKGANLGLACGMGAQHPRFGAENLTQVAGSYGGVAFMVMAVLYILATVALLAWPASVYLWHDYRGLPIAPHRQAWMAVSLATAAALAVVTFLGAMRKGVRALEELA